MFLDVIASSNCFFEYYYASEGPHWRPALRRLWFTGPGSPSWSPALFVYSLKLERVEIVMGSHEQATLLRLQNMVTSCLECTRLLQTKNGSGWDFSR